MRLITRKEAKELGLKFYFTGKPCKRGHLSEKRTTNSTCKACEEIKGKSKEHKEQCVAYRQRTNNASSKKYIENNRDAHKGRCKSWKQRNKGAVNNSTAKRRAAKLQATPSWLSETQLLEIKSFYSIAQWYQQVMHVDHIVPLQGDTVCGLHVPWNLQILTKEDNERKNNTWNP